MNIDSILKNHSIIINNKKKILEFKNKLVIEGKFKTSKVILKIGFGVHYINKIKNEINFYKENNSIYSFSFPNMVSYAIKQNYAFIILSKINGQKISFLESLFINLKPEITKYIYLKKYLRNKNLYNFFLQKINDQFYIENVILPIGRIHGDMIHWNILKKRKEKYLIDYEYYNKNSFAYYDIFKMIIIPIFHRKISIFIFNNRSINSIFLNFVFIFFFIKGYRFSLLEFKTYYYIFLIDFFYAIQNDKKKGQLNDSTYQNLFLNLKRYLNFG